MKLSRRRILLALLAGLLLAAIFPFSARAEDIPPEASVCCIYGFPQTYNLSCEARAAADWASFFGYSVTEYELMAAFPTSDDPEEGFVGSWNGYWGNIPPYAYGIHPPPVAATLRDFGIPAKAYTNLTWDDLRREIAAGRPAIIWVIAQMWPGTPIEYTAESGNTTIVAYYEHAMVLTGYTETSVQVLDAGTGTIKYFYLDAFLQSWGVLGNRAILAGDPDTDRDAHPHPLAYANRPGDRPGRGHSAGDRGEVQHPLADPDRPQRPQLSLLHPSRRRPAPALRYKADRRSTRIS